MAKTNAKGLEKLGRLLTSVIDLQEDLAFRMFLDDRPEASLEEFKSSAEKPRYMAYATTAITRLMPGN